jgi:propanediol utilization protein
MAKNWYKEAEKALEPGDEIQKSYPGDLEGERGYLIISNKRLMFQNVKGFLSKKYNITMNVLLESIRGVGVTEDKAVEIGTTDKKYIMNPDEVPTSIVIKSITEAKG